MAEEKKFLGTAGVQRLIDNIRGEITEAVEASEEAAAGKYVEQVPGKSLVSDTEINKLSGVSNDANKVENVGGGKIKIDGTEAIVYEHPATHSSDEVVLSQPTHQGYAGKTVTEAVDSLKGEIDGVSNTAGANRQSIEALEGDDVGSSVREIAESVVAGHDFDNTYSPKEHDHTAGDITDFDSAVKAYDYATKSEAGTYAVNALNSAKGYTDGLVGALPDGTDATTVVEYIDAKTANIASDETVGQIDDRVKEIEGDYLKASDKTDLQNQINTIMNNPDAEGAINSINEFTAYIEEHGEIADGFRKDIDDNKQAIQKNANYIAAQITSNATTYETKSDASAKLTEAKTHSNNLNAAMDTRVKVLEAIDHDAYKAYADQAEADAITAAAADAKTKADKALEDANAHSDGLNAAMNTRVGNLEAVTYTEITADDVDAMFAD